MTYSTTDPFEPIAGISLERYAQLAALMAEFDGDLDACTRIAREQGVGEQDWQVAMAGWNRRLADPANSASVAIKYVECYRSEVAKLRGAA